MASLLLDDGARRLIERISESQALRPDPVAV
jgi:hypothetical protein